MLRRSSLGVQQGRKAIGEGRGKLKIQEESGVETGTGAADGESPWPPSQPPHGRPEEAKGCEGATKVGEAAAKRPPVEGERRQSRIASSWMSQGERTVRFLLNERSAARRRSSRVA